MLILSLALFMGLVSIAFAIAGLREEKIIEVRCCPHGYKDWDDCPDCCH